MKLHQYAQMKEETEYFKRVIKEKKYNDQFWQQTNVNMEKQT